MNRYSYIVVTVGRPEQWGDKKKFPITSTGYKGAIPQHLGGFNVVTPTPKTAYRAAKEALASEMEEFGVTRGWVLDAATGQKVTEADESKPRLKNPLPEKHPPHSVVVYTTVWQPWEEGDDEPDHETDEGETFSAEPDEYDIEEAEETRHVDSPLSALSIAAATKAAKIILDDGYVEPSQSPGYGPRLWYTTADADENYRTGERTEKSFHLYGWTEAEERAVYDDVMFAMRPRR